MVTSIALVGNPNSGKSTLFNSLTGSKQHVANYPGITVDKKIGRYKRNDINLKIVDLPGTYSLTAYSLEEVVTRNFLMNEKPDGIINVVDASNLERNLYLSIQILELGIPTCIALNMIDVASKNGIVINTIKLSDILGIPIVPVIARTSFGKNKLIKILLDHLAKQRQSNLKISYGTDIDRAIDKIEIIINRSSYKKYPSRWLAIKFLENDKEIISNKDFINIKIKNKIEEICDKIIKHTKKTTTSYPEAIIADHRYGYITSILRQDVLIENSNKNRASQSDRIDKVLVNRLAGPIIMFLILVGLYHFTFTYSKIPILWCDSLFKWFTIIISENMNNDMIKNLLVSAVINGAGGVLGFVPMIMFMFFGIAIIEDSGYLARVAFMMDRIFQFFSLHGSSVMPYIISGGIAGGCAVPGVMATRALKSPKERIATLLTVSFMSCGAKLPIITILIAIFFDEKNTEIMLVITIISWLSALTIAKILRLTIISGKSTPFVMELPPYRLPTFKGLLIHTWERVWQYIKKASTIILGISILLWIVMTFPKLNIDEIREIDKERKLILLNFTYNSHKIKYTQRSFEQSRIALMELSSKQSKKSLINSVAGKFGVCLEKVSKWAGFDWRTNISLLGGFAAKEIIISTLGTVYSLENIQMKDNNSFASILKSKSGWTSLSALSLIVFIIFYSPCSATIICIVKETSLKWGIFSIFFNTLLAFFLSVLIFQVGSFLGY